MRADPGEDRNAAADPGPSTSVRAIRRLLELLRSRATPIAASRVASAALAAVIVFVTSGVLTPSRRGEFAALQSGAVLAASAGGLSLALGVAVVVGERATATRPAAILALLGSLALAVVLVPLGLLAAPALGVSQATTTAVALTAATIAAYGALLGLAVGLGRMAYYGAADVARAVVAMLAVLAALAAGVRSPGLLVAVWAAGPVTGVLAIGRLARERGGEPFGAVARTALRRSLRAHPTSLAGLAVARLDIVVLAAVSTHAQVAYYSLAVVISEAAWLMPSALAVTSLSDFVRLPTDRAWQAARRALGPTLLIAAVSAALAAMGGAAAILVFLSPAYHAALVPLAIALAGAIPYSVGHVVSPYLVTAIDRPGLATAMAVATVALDVLLVLLLGGPLGALGAAVASTASYALHAALNLGALNRAQPA